jgi:acetyltransferase-like isoleucine patch superfamily enzyme
MIRNLTVLLFGLLPACRLKSWLLRRVGFDVHRTARVYASIFWSVPKLELHAGARIGRWNVVRGCSLSVGESSTLGQFNWVTASTAFHSQPRALVMGKHAAITSRHYIDCAGGIEVGDFTTLAGVHSVLLTHGIDVSANRQTSSSIRIGEYCMVGACVKITPGSVVGPRSFVAMGAVVHGELPGGALYAGVPAKAVRSVDGKYFRRSTGYVE